MAKPEQTSRDGPAIAMGAGLCSQEEIVKSGNGYSYYISSS